MGDLKREMERAALRGITDDHTAKAYKRHVTNFCIWVKNETGIGRLEKISDRRQLVQEYTDNLQARNLAAATVHTYLAPICKGLGLTMDRIRKPKRHAVDIVRSRRPDSPEVNAQGKKEAVAPRYSRVMALQNATGMRRGELAALTVDCLQLDESDAPCVAVRKGKGGKMQLQRLLRRDIPTVLDIFERAKTSCEADGADPHTYTVLTRDEMKNKIDLHGVRAEHARECYREYASRCADPGERQQLITEMIARWNAAHRHARTGEHHHISRSPQGDYEAHSAQSRKFLDEISGRPYKVRGGNRTRALAAGLPTVYDRTALLCVSVFHLAHWRVDVTVTNYML